MTTTRMDDLVSGLEEYHRQLAADGDSPFDPKLAFARSIEVLGETRAAALTIFDAAIVLLEDDRPEAALRMLREAVERFRPERKVQ